MYQQCHSSSIYSRFNWFIKKNTTIKVNENIKVSENGWNIKIYPIRISGSFKTSKEWYD